jgi:hypothetical protein
MEIGKGTDAEGWTVGWWVGNVDMREVIFSVSKYDSTLRLLLSATFSRRV